MRVIEKGGHIFYKRWIRKGKRKTCPARVFLLSPLFFFLEKREFESPESHAYTLIRLCLFSMNESEGVQIHACNRERTKHILREFEKKRLFFLSPSLFFSKRGERKKLGEEKDVLRTFVFSLPLSFFSKRGSSSLPSGTYIHCSLSPFPMKESERVWMCACD